jgi:hypothetical protein
MFIFKPSDVPVRPALTSTLMAVLLFCTPADRTFGASQDATPDTVPNAWDVSNRPLATAWLWSNDLETDQPFDTQRSHPGALVLRTAEWPHAGLYSLKLTTPSTIYNRASALKVLPFSEQIHVAELWFYLPTGQGQDVGFEVAMEGWSGSEQHLASIHWAHDTRFGLTGWRRWVGGKWEFLPGGRGVAVSPGAWHHLQAEVDYTRKTYRKLVIDGRTFDLTGLPYDASRRATVSSSYQVSILLWNQTPVPRTAYVDDVRLGEAR